ncbi:GNAT family N-acetyltransferase [Desulfovibrio cuneatus]|uniref:GNAT family N-acetyltransferase n=1 Tax=Desulfovibrio cuneatus TaxID=159728 RepID=UPI001FDF8CF9|nr:GNAT family N-acetyltransferase [Desulfovibrio cuneatus]
MAELSRAMLSVPAPLTKAHALSHFSCGEHLLDDWLRQRAMKNELSGATRTYVVCSGKAVVGYYSLAVGSIEHQFTPGSIRRNMPQPIPVMLLARLAVDQNHTGQNMGTGMLRDALLRTLQAATIAGIRALLVHALHERAASFYLNRGFIVSPFDPLVLLLNLDHARATIAP